MASLPQRPVIVRRIRSQTARALRGARRRRPTPRALLHRHHRRLPRESLSSRVRNLRHRPLVSIPRRHHRERLRRALASSSALDERGAESPAESAADAAPESTPERRVVIDIASRRDTIERIETERLAYPLPRPSPATLSLALSLSLSLSLSVLSRSLSLSRAPPPRGRVGSDSTDHDSPRTPPLDTHVSWPRPRVGIFTDHDSSISSTPRPRRRWVDGSIGRWVDGSMGRMNDRWVE